MIQTKIPKTLLKRLEKRQENNALRELSYQNFAIDFWSNDYLGFAQSTEIQQLAHQIHSQYTIQNGATGSRLISGNHLLYEKAEAFIRDFHHSQDCVIFNSGYDANLGIFSSIPQKGDLVLYDQYIHASIREGMLLSHAKSLKFKHNDLTDLEKILQKIGANFQNIYIVTEAVFSMDGDSPDLKKMVLLSQKYNAFLIVDEAHSLGIFGKKGEGLVQHLGLENDIFIRLVTFGKALGCHGAAVLSSQKVVQYLINFARSFIYTTGLPTHSVALILAGYMHLSKGNHQKLLFENIHFFRKKIQDCKLSNLFVDSFSPIQAMFYPGNEAVKNMARQLQEQNIGIKPILSPTIEQGKERLRICLHSFNTENEINFLFEMLNLNQ